MCPLAGDAQQADDALLVWTADSEGVRIGRTVPAKPKSPAGESASTSAPRPAARMLSRLP